jgi:hypothetical protein
MDSWAVIGRQKKRLSVDKPTLVTVDDSITAHHLISIHGTIKSPSTTVPWDEESNKILK